MSQEDITHLAVGNSFLCILVLHFIHIRILTDLSIKEFMVLSLQPFQHYIEQLKCTSLKIMPQQNWPSMDLLPSDVTN